MTDWNRILITYFQNEFGRTLEHGVIYENCVYTTPKKNELYIIMTFYCYTFGGRTNSICFTFFFLLLFWFETMTERRTHHFSHRCFWKSLCHGHRWYPFTGSHEYFAEHNAVTGNFVPFRVNKKKIHTCYKRESSFFFCFLSLTLLYGKAPRRYVHKNLVHFFDLDTSSPQVEHKPPATAIVTRTHSEF